MPLGIRPGVTITQGASLVPGLAVSMPSRKPISAGLRRPGAMGGPRARPLSRRTRPTVFFDRRQRLRLVVRAPRRRCSRTCGSPRRRRSASGAICRQPTPPVARMRSRGTSRPAACKAPSKPAQRTQRKAMALLPILGARSSSGVDGPACKLGFLSDRAVARRAARSPRDEARPRRSTSRLDQALAMPPKPIEPIFSKPKVPRTRGAASWSS